MMAASRASVLASPACRSGNAAHGQTWRIGDQNAFIACNCHRQRADGGRLIDDEQNLAVRLEFGDEGAQFGFVVEGSACW